MSDNANTINVHVLTIFQEMGDVFVESVGGSDVRIGDRRVHFEVLAGDPRVNPSWKDDLARAGALILLVRFMDIISMDKVKAIFRSIPPELGLPTAIVLFREEGEADFKISCGACGQKLWVRDTDAGKRGRCPNCKKSFPLPSQDEHLRSQLEIPASVLVSRVNKNMAACQVAVAALLGQVRRPGSGAPVRAATDEAFDPDILKQTTMRIQLSGDTSTGGVVDGTQKL